MCRDTYPQILSDAQPYSHCYPWDQEHQRLPELQQDHECRGNQEHQQYRKHPAGLESRGVRNASCAGFNLISERDTYRGTLSTRGAIGSGCTLLRGDAFSTELHLAFVLVLAMWKFLFLNSQQLQQVQKVLGYQPHHGLPGVHPFHGLLRGRSLPAEASNAVSENMNSISFSINQ